MGNKKINRDLALKVLEIVGGVKDALDDLLGSMFIIYQPKDVAGAVGEVTVLTVVAMNVNSYQWQTARIGSDTWTNASSPGNTTDTISITVRASSYEYRVRCKLTDSDGNIIYTNDAYISRPE